MHRREALAATGAALSAALGSLAFPAAAMANTNAVRDLIDALDKTRDDLEDASGYIDEVAAMQQGRTVTRADHRRWIIANRKERAAILALCSYRCTGPTEFAERAAYLLEYDRRMELQSEHVTALLLSML